MKNLALFLITITIAGQTLAATPKVSRKIASIPNHNIQVGGSDEVDACEGTGIVTATTTLFGWDKKNDRTFDKVDVNQFVAICGESEDNEYVGIVFGSKDQDCKVKSPIVVRGDYKGPCKSGWIKKTFLEYLAG